MHLFTLLITVLTSASFAIAPSLQAQNDRPGDAETTKTLHVLFETEWDYQMEQNPTRASVLGDRR